MLIFKRTARYSEGELKPQVIIQFEEGEVDCWAKLHSVSGNLLAQVFYGDDEVLETGEHTVRLYDIRSRGA